MAIATPADNSLAVTAVNLALAKIGVSKTITTLADQSREARTASLIYDHEYEGALRSYPWAFATKYLNLTLHSGTSTVPAVGDFQYAYVYPSDCMFARRIVTTMKRQFDAAPIPFRVGRLSHTKVVFSDLDDQSRLGLSVASVCLEYTALFDCPTDLADQLFVAALSWRLAASLAPSLSKIAKMHDRATQMYLITLRLAEAVDANEGQLERPGEAAYINDGWDGGT